jgi:hypothetical protein
MALSFIIINKQASKSLSLTPVHSLFLTLVHSLYKLEVLSELSPRLF